MGKALTWRENTLLAHDQQVRPWHQVDVVLLDREIDPDDIAIRIAQRLDYVPRGRQVVVPTITGPAWVDDLGFDVHRHIHPTRVEGVTALPALVANALSASMSRAKPLWDVAVATGLGGGRSALIVRAHHALVDGLDHVHLLGELLDEYPTPILGPMPDWEPAPEPDVTAEPLAALTRGVKNPLGMLGSLGAGLSGAVDGVWRRATASAQPRYAGGIEVGLEPVRRVRTSFATSTHDVLLALAAAAIRRWREANGEPLTDPVALVPQAVVAQDVLASAVGCRVVPQWLTMPVRQPDPVERLREIASLTRSRTDAGDTVKAGELASLIGFAPPTLHALAAGTVTGGQPHHVLIANAPGPRTKRYFGEALVRGTYTLPSLTDSQRVGIGITSYDSRVWFGVCADAPTGPLTDGITAALAELLALAGER